MYSFNARSFSLGCVTALFNSANYYYYQEFEKAIYSGRCSVAYQRYYKESTPHTTMKICGLSWCLMLPTYTKEDCVLYFHLLLCSSYKSAWSPITTLLSCRFKASLVRHINWSSLGFLMPENFHLEQSSLKYIDLFSRFSSAIIFWLL